MIGAITSAIVFTIWLGFIERIAGFAAAAFTAGTALAICLLSFWEAGYHKKTESMTVDELDRRDADRHADVMQRIKEARDSLPGRDRV